MFGIGHQELIIIFAIVFLIFGAKRLPEMGKGLGLAIRGFKGAIQEAPEPRARGKRFARKRNLN